MNSNFTSAVADSNGPHILGLEGNVCSGKTTIGFEYCRKNYRSFFVPEYWEMIADGERAILLKQDADGALRMMFAIEEQRCNVLSGTNFPIVCDRTILTALVTHFVRLRLGEQGDVELSSQLLRNARVTKPDLFIFFDVESAVQLERWRSRGAGASIFVNSDFHHLYKQSFHCLAEYLPMTIIRLADEAVSTIVQKIELATRNHAPSVYCLADALRHLASKV